MVLKWFGLFGVCLGVVWGVSTVRQSFSDVIISWRRVIFIAGQLIVSVSSRFCFIMVVSMIYLFVVDYSLTS